jgi:succinate dehydrogenase / fumarate reductase cytochrome b subunit
LPRTLLVLLHREKARRRLTGLFLVLFLAGHLVGNLVVFMGPEPFNAYAYFLHHMLHGAGIWLFRIGDAGDAWSPHHRHGGMLTKQNKAARKAYEHPATIQASRSSRTMIVSGLTILAFFVYHMLHFTVRVSATNTTIRKIYRIYMPGGQGSPQRLEDGDRRILGLAPATIFYVIAMTLLASHLAHGVQSIFQTLGLRSKKSASLINQISIGYASFIWIGFISIPIAILFGFGR